MSRGRGRAQVPALLRTALRRARAQEGFTIIETLVATVVITVGLLTAFMMLSVAVHSSAAVKAREGAVALARQITEDAREIPYSQIDSSTLTTSLQGFPGLANISSGSSWQVNRNNVTYTITASLNYLNDANDSSHGVTTTCSSSAQVCDIKQVTATVSWSLYGNQTHSISETATMTRAGQDPGLSVSGLQVASWGGTGTVTQNSSTSWTVSSSTVTSLTFSVVAQSGTTAIVWSLNGSKQSSFNGSTPSSGTTWTSSPWSLSGVSDGTYTVGAQSEDSSGIDGPGVTITVRLIRNVPGAPSVTGDGFNAALPGAASTAAEFTWSANSELNVVGYEIDNPSGQTVCQNSTTTTYPATCGTGWCSSLTACIDLSPPSVSASNLTYHIYALYYDVNNVLQKGTGKSVTLASGTPSAPGAVTNLQGSQGSDGSATLTWTPPAGGTAVSFYRIYRDGNTYTSRYDTLSASACSATCSYHDTAATTTHTYYVTAVGGTTLGADMAESSIIGPVSG